MAEEAGQAGTKRTHLIERNWGGPGIYPCRCGASIEAVNEDVLRWIFLDHCVREAVKQSRAKVLVACIKAADEHNSFNHDDGSPCSGYCGEIIASKIRSLRPAAKDLEELREKARIQGAIDELALLETERAHRGWFAFDLYEYIDVRMKEHKAELAELEKARASEGKG